MKISVAMCTYNGERYVAEQVESIIAQTHGPGELLVFDDRSGDGTIAVIERLAKVASFPIRITVNAERLGSTRNFERAIGACSGDVIALSDQDDVWLPHKLATIRAAFEADAALGAFFSNAEVVDDSLRPLGYGMFDYCRLSADEFARLDRGDIFDLLLEKSFVTGAALAFRSDLRRFISPMPPGSAYMIHDRWIAIITAAVSKLGYTREKLIRYRQHAGQQLGAAMAETSLAARLASGRRRDMDVYAANLEFLRQVRDGVVDNGDDAVKPAFRESLDACIRHLEVRTRLPANRLARIGAIVGELTSKRYVRFSKGVISAAKDLIL